MSSINLVKGEKINLAKEAPNTKKFAIALGWDANVTNTGYDFDLDASIFAINSKGKVPNEKFFVYYNNLKTPDGAVTHTGDNLTGNGDGDDETIYVDISRLDSTITEIIVIVNIYQADSRKQNFGQVRNSYVRLYDVETNQEIAKYELDEDFSKETAIEFGRLYKKDNQWRFDAVGAGYVAGLRSFVDKYCQ